VKLEKAAQGKPSAKYRPTRLVVDAALRRLPDTSDLGHFGPKTFRPGPMEKIARHFGSRSEVSNRSEMSETLRTCLKFETPRTGALLFTARSARACLILHCDGV